MSERHPTLHAARDINEGEKMCRVAKLSDLREVMQPPQALRRYTEHDRVAVGDRDHPTALQLKVSAAELIEFTGFCPVPAFPLHVFPGIFIHRSPDLKPRSFNPFSPAFEITTNNSSIKQFNWDARVKLDSLRKSRPFFIC